MFCSTIIPTIGRPSLERAVKSVLDQDFTADSLEVIVVNDSGQPLSAGDWQHSDRVTVIRTNRRERSFARNAGAAAARGRYLHFLDDDDWMLPGAFERFWRLAQTTDASVLYGASLLVDDDAGRRDRLYLGKSGNCFTQVMTGEWIPLQASLFRADVFFAAGGFNPFSTPGEDRCMSQRVALIANFACTEENVAVLERGGASSTDYRLAMTHSRREREKILGENGVFARMRTSASSSYWRGRLVRAYLASAVWNIRNRGYLTAVSRVAHGLTSFGMALPVTVSPEFWRALTRTHSSRID